MTFDVRLLSFMPADFHSFLDLFADQEAKLYKARQMATDVAMEEDEPTMIESLTEVCASSASAVIYASSASSSGPKKSRKRNRASQLSATVTEEQVSSSPVSMPIDSALHTWQKEIAIGFRQELAKCPEIDPLEVCERWKAGLSLDWKHYWNLPPTFWYDTRNPNKIRLCTAMISDGVAVAFRFETIKRIQFPTEKKAKRAKGSIRTKEELQAAKEFAIAQKNALPYSENVTRQSLIDRNIIGILTIDTNRKNFFVAAFRRTEHLTSSPSVSSHPRDIIIHFSKAHLKHIRGTKHEQHVRDAMAQREYGSAEEAARMQAAPSLKSTSMARFTEWKQFMEHDERFLRNIAFYRLRTFRRLRMESFSAQQHFWSHVQDHIYRELNRHLKLPDKLIAPRKNLNTFQRQGISTPRILIAMGDGSFRHNSAGHMTMPTGSRMYGELQKLGEYMCWVDEYNTSKCCAVCGNEMEPSILRKKQSITRTSPHRKQSRVQVLPDEPIPPDPPDPAYPLVRSGVFERQHRRPTKPSAICRHSKPVQIPTKSVGLLDTSSSPSLDAHYYPLSSQQQRVESDVVAPWGLRSCFSKQCRNRIFDRDACATINMLHRVSWSLSHSGEAGPSYLLRVCTSSSSAG